MNAIHHINDVGLTPTSAVELQTGNTINKANLLKALGIAGKFPNYYAANFDSAWDCLQDVENLPHLLLNTVGKTVHNDELKAFISLISDANDAWGYPELWIVK